MMNGINGLESLDVVNDLDSRTDLDSRMIVELRLPTNSSKVTSFAARIEVAPFGLNR